MPEPRHADPGPTDPTTTDPTTTDPTTTATEHAEPRHAMSPHHRDPREDRPWPALWSLVIGFFMILIDTTIVSVALPRLIDGLQTDVVGGVWVTSAYLLAYAVPLLITGRLGDRIGPKTMYLVGLTIFTAASLWCGLSGSIEVLITARVVQGLGAAAMTPQTMAVITRMFPGERRGPAMAVWGATAGMAVLVGPLLGGLLTDALGWEWIFFVNVPVGIVGFVLALRFVPRLAIRSHRFDLLGVVLSAVALFLLVFGIQEGQTYDWSTITDNLTVLGIATGITISVPGLIIAGAVLMVAFVVWQRLNRAEPLVPLGLFADRNFSVANLGITMMGFAVVAVSLPYTLYLQLVRGLSPTQAALMLIPLAVMSFVMARPVGRLVGRVDPRFLAIVGFALSAAAVAGYALLMHADTPLLLFLLPAALQGFANSLVWSPLSLSATYNLSPDRAGAGSGVYNATRQFGSVLGSAAIAVLMEARIAAQLSGAGAGGAAGGEAGFTAGALPEPLQEPFATAMSQAILLPAAALALGFVVCLFFAPIRRRPVPDAPTGGRAEASLR